MTANKEWPCEHIKMRGSGWTVNDGEILKETMYCYICGAKRPEEPKALWETMEILLKDIPLTTDVHKRISIEAIKWFKGKLPENSCDPVMVSIIQLLDKEIEKSKWGK